MIRTFSSKESNENLLAALNRSLVRSAWKHWGEDVVVGRVRGPFFEFYPHHKNRGGGCFQKVLSGFVIPDGEGTKAVTFLISPFLTVGAHLKVILIFCVLALIRLAWGDGWMNPLPAYVLIAKIMIALGAFAQLVPFPKAKTEALYGFMESCTGTDPAE